MKRMMRTSVTLCMILTLLIAVPFATRAEQPSYASNEEWQVLKLTNAERRKRGMDPFSTFGALDDAAQVRAKEIVDKMEHTRPDNTSCFTVLNGISYWCAGENIAGGQTDAEWVVEAWMDSEGHRANILQKDSGRPYLSFKHMGMGYYYDANSLYKHHWVQLFLGGCETLSLANAGYAPVFDQNGKLTSDAMLAVTCSRHGTCYLPLADTYYTYLGNGTYTVTYDGVTVTLPAAGTNASFSDVRSTDWFAPMVEYAVENGLMKGKGEGKFAPNDQMTRAELVTLFYRMEGEPAHSGQNPFRDIRATDWYYDEVLWAAENGLVQGKGEGRFDPQAPITRVELAVLFARYARQEKGVDTSDRASVSSFPDAGKIPSWGLADVQWAVQVGLIKGKSNGIINYLEPLSSATRAEVATLLQRFIENIL
ncbi:MAG: S-layer homology domain-containing protein [Clostridia bacterium]|nr:S-layer homology domain-containing protein [Clostridia bacterium]